MLLLPHALFGGVALAIKLLFPRVVTYLARDTYLIFGLSVLYPWMWTVSLLFQYRHGDAINKQKEADASPAATTRRQTPLKDHTSPSQTRKTTDRTCARTRSKTSTSSNMHPRTTPKTPPSSSSSRATPRTPVQRLMAASKPASDFDMQREAKYWLDYWLIYSLFTAFCKMISLIPIAGRIASKSTWLSALSVELQLCFYIWIYGLSSVLESTASSDADLQRSYLVRPIPFLVKRASPHVQRVYKSISEDLISPKVWAALVAKCKSFLSVAVMVRLISEKSQDRLLKLLESAHPFLVPSMTLFMPGFVTSYGVLYVQSVVPATKACQAKKSLSDTMSSLQYWVLQALLGGTLHWLSSLLWWIPFSTHLVFLLWCQLLQSADSCYDILEMELQAFGLLPPSNETKLLPMEQTVTATMLRKLANSLPSAASDDVEENDDAVSSDEVVPGKKPDELSDETPDEAVLLSKVTTVTTKRGKTESNKLPSKRATRNSGNVPIKTRKVSPDSNADDDLSIDENGQKMSPTPRRSTRTRKPRRVSD